VSEIVCTFAVEFKNLTCIGQSQNVMKKIIFLFSMLCVSLISFCQLQIDSFYVNKSENLIYSKIENIDSLSSQSVITSIKNWGSTNFVNLKEVLVSETENQLVFNYITKDFYLTMLGLKQSYDWYIRLIIQIKNNRIRLLVYDDGNVFVPGSYNGRFPIPARSRYFSIYFNKKGLAMKIYEDGLLNVKNESIITCNSLISQIKNKKINSIDNW
jgi:hypothetical protein